MSAAIPGSPLDSSTGDRSSQFVNVSFRDPGGQVVICNQRVFRVINDNCRKAIDEFLASELCESLVGKEILIRSRPVNDLSLKQELSRFGMFQGASPLVLEHEHIDFPSYPYEWPPEMLHAAGELTLDLMERLLPDNFGLKDASPSNILFRGTQPIFIDLLSIEPRDDLDPTWLAYDQFTRTFIRPLLANKYFGIGLDQIFRVHRDGLQPDHVFRMCSVWKKLHPLFLTSVSIPLLLSRIEPAKYQKIYQARRARSAEEALFILKRQVKGLRRKLRETKPSQGESSWSDYERRQHLGERYLPAKQRFVETALKQRRPHRVLDVGCNTGKFSSLAAAAGCSVVAIDQDSVVVGELWRRASEHSLRILPLVIDLTRPTPGLGWRNHETRGFLDRALGAFDCVFMFAVIHHMLVTERIPLKEILKLASELTTDLLIVEFIPRSDPMFRLLMRGNEDLYEYLTRELFESVSSSYFVIERSEELGETERWIYQMRRRAAIV